MVKNKKNKTDKPYQSKTHLVNFIGYCTSNVIFLIKVLYLVHDVDLLSGNNGVRLNEEDEMGNYHSNDDRY